MQFEDIMKLLLNRGKNEGEESQDSEQPADAPAKEENKKGTWRHHLDESLHNELNCLVHSTHKHRHAYKRTLKVRDAQLWVALAQMSRRVSQLEERLGIAVKMGSPAVSAETPCAEQELTVQQVAREQPAQQMLISGQPASEAPQQEPPEQSEPVQESS